MTKNLKVLIAVTMLVGLGCSIKDDANKTRKTTEQMRDTVEETNKTSKDLNKKSGHLAKRTDDLERELITKESYSMLIESLDYLFNRFPTSESDNRLSSEPEMVGFAGAAVLSMPFQFWKGDYKEDKSFLDWRFEMSLQALLPICVKHVPRDFNIFRLQDRNPSNSYKALASLGSQLDKMMPAYEEAIKGAGIGPLSLYDVLMLALKNRDSIERTEVVPRSIAFALQFKKEIQYIIQLRHNYLPMMVMSRMGDFQDRGVIGRLKARFIGQSIDLGIADGSLKQSADVEQIKEWTRWLNQALETRAALRAMKIPVEYNLMFLGILGNLDFGQKAILAISVEKATPRQLLLRKLAEAYEEVTHPPEDAIPADWGKGWGSL